MPLMTNGGGKKREICVQTNTERVISIHLLSFIFSDSTQIQPLRTDDVSQSST
jgi:hypothetical protein